MERFVKAGVSSGMCFFMLSTTSFHFFQLCLMCYCFRMGWGFAPAGLPFLSFLFFLLFTIYILFGDYVNISSLYIFACLVCKLSAYISKYVLKSMRLIYAFKFHSYISCVFP